MQVNRAYFINVMMVSCINNSLQRMSSGELGWHQSTSREGARGGCWPDLRRLGSGQREADL